MQTLLNELALCCLKTLRKFSQCLKILLQTQNFLMRINCLVHFIAKHYLFKLLTYHTLEFTQKC